MPSIARASHGHPAPLPLRTSGLPKPPHRRNLHPMRIIILIIALLGILFAAIGCEKTVYEPGEPEHGGVFLHGDPSVSTRP